MWLCGQPHMWPHNIPHSKLGVKCHIMWFILCYVVPHNHIMWSVSHNNIVNWAMFLVSGGGCFFGVTGSSLISQKKVLEKIPTQKKVDFFSNFRGIIPTHSINNCNLGFCRKVIRLSKHDLYLSQSGFVG